MSENETTDLESNGTKSDHEVEACPHCDHAGAFREHVNNGHNARDPERYRETELTCKNCGGYCNRDELVKRPPRAHRGGGRISEHGKSLIEADPSIIGGDHHA